MSTLHSYWRSKTAWILQRNVRILLAIIGKKSDECTTKNQRRNAHGNQIQCDNSEIARKELVNVISKATGMKAVYKFMPTCNFEIGSFTVNKEGTLLIDAHADNEEVARVLEAIAAASFEGETQDTQESPAEDASAEEVLAEEESLPSQEDAT